MLLDENDKVVAFLALSPSPCFIGRPLDRNEIISQHPDALVYNDHYIGHVLHYWDEWFQARFECSKLKIESTHFLVSWLCSKSCSVDDQKLWLGECLKQAYNAVGDLQSVALVADDGEELNPVLRSVFGECKRLNSQTNLQLYTCPKAKVVPVLSVRKARVEDCDDVAPLLREHQFIGDQEDHSLAELLDSELSASTLGSGADTLSLVAIVDSAVVGFLRVTKYIDVAMVGSKFKLDAYDNLRPIRPDTSMADSQVGQTFNLAVETNKHARDSTLSVSLFCMDPLYAHESSAFLKAAFQFHPECDYLACALPTTEKYFPLLNSMSRVANRSLSDSDQVLYLATKYGVLDRCTVRPAIAKDSADIIQFVQSNSAGERNASLLKLLESSAIDKSVSLFVVEAAFQIVGLAVLSECPLLFTLATQFELREWTSIPIRLDEGLELSKALVRLVAFQLHPLFQSQARQVFSELLRQTHTPFFVFHTLPVEFGTEISVDFPNVSNTDAIDECFFPVQPKREIQYPNNVRDGTKVSLPLLTRLQVLPSSRITESRAHVNDRIVVVGSSATALSLLENLIYFGHVYFKNVVLVSNEGLPCLDDPLFVSNNTFTDSKLRQLSLPHYAHVINAEVPSIDRVEKRVRLNGGNSVPYDVCVITAGLQFHVENHSKLLGSLSSQVVNMNRAEVEKFQRNLDAWKASAFVKTEIRGSTTLLYDKDSAENAVVLEEDEEEEEGLDTATRDEDARGVLRAASAEACFAAKDETLGSAQLFESDNGVQFYKSSSDPFIVVFGRDLQAYASVRGLLDRGVDAKCIGLVTPPVQLNLPPSDAFNNCAISTKMEEVLASLKVAHFANYVIDSFDCSDESAGTDSAGCSGRRLLALNIKKFDSKKVVKLPCQLFLYADEKSVKPATFEAIDDACLVYDGRLVIDKHFQTSDSDIYAAGSLTKYASSYQTPWNHSFFDYREVGNKLSQFLLPRFTELAPQPASMILLDPVTQLPFFEQSKKVVAQLPGGYHYAHFDIPRLPTYTLEERQKSVSTYGRELVIDQPNLGYFRIHVNPEGYIHGLTYFGQRRIPFNNYTCLYQLHQLYVNRLCSRFDEGIIQDFVSFFNEDWAILLYHPHMRPFLANIRSEMMQYRSVSFRSLLEQLQHLDLKDVHPETRKQIYHAFDNSVDRQFLAQKVWKFLEESGVYDLSPTTFPTS